MEFRTSGETVRVNVTDAATLSRQVSGRLARGEGFALATLNLDHLAKLRDSVAFRRAYAAQDFVVADGNPVVWLSRLAGRRVDLLPGSDLVVPLAALAAALGVAVALVGSTAAVLEDAADALRAEVPGLRIVARIAPPFGFDPGGALAEAVFAELAASGAGLCFLALGAPKQEMLAARGRTVLPGMGFASVGAGLDFLAGKQRRAPRWVRRLALEWLWRLAHDPRRLARRYLHCALVFPGHTARTLATRLRGWRRAPGG